MNGISHIHDEDGDYIILRHYSGEGIGVVCQFNKLEEAIQYSMEIDGDKAIVKLVDVAVEEL